MAIICNFTKKVKADSFINAKNISLALNKTAQLLNIKGGLELAVVIVSPGEIKKLNRKYRQINKVTDVLSFREQDGEPVVLHGKTKYLGDIVICWQQVKKQAPQFKQSVKKEFMMLVCHGFLHLLGYDDKTASQYRKMELIQDKLINILYG